MSAELFNLWLFFAVIGKVLLITGLGPAIAIAIVWERYRVVGFGFETVHHRVTETQRKSRGRNCRTPALLRFGLCVSVPLWWKRSLRRHA